MQAKIQKPGNSFSFACDAKRMADTLSKVFSVTAFSSASEAEKHHILMAYKEKVFVVGYSPETFVCVRLQVDDTPTTSGCFEFDISALQGLIKKRAGLAFDYSNNSFKMKALKGKYSCELKTIELSEEILVRINKSLRSQKEGESLTSTELLSLKDAVSHTAIKEVYQDDKDNSLLCYISFDKGIMTVSAMDNFHMAYYKSKIKSKSKFRLALSSSMFGLISKFVTEEDEDEDASFSLSSKGLIVAGGDFIITLPPSQVEDSHFDLVPIFLKQNKKSVCDFSLPKDAFDTIDNMKSLAKNDEKFLFSLNEKGIVKLTIETDSGIVSDAFKTKNSKSNKKRTWNVDPRLFFDLYKKIRTLNKDIPMSLHGSANGEDSSAFFITKLMLSESSSITLVGTYE